jgi:hypothetical protein
MGHARRQPGGQAPNQASTPTGPVPATTSGQVPIKARGQSVFESRSSSPTRSPADLLNCTRDTHNQCSRHDIPPAVRGDLTDQQGHNLELELEALATVVLTCWWLGDQLHTRRERGGRSPLGNNSGRA